MSPAEDALLLEPHEAFHAKVRQRVSFILRLSPVVFVESENCGSRNRPIKSCAF